MKNQICKIGNNKCGEWMSFYASLDRFQKMKRQRVAYMLNDLFERGGFK